MNDIEVKDMLEAGGLCLLDFYADWGVPCKNLAPTIEELKEEYEGRVNIGSVNVEDCPEASTNAMIRNIPTLILYRDGVAIDKLVGGVSKDKISSMIESALNG